MLKRLYVDNVRCLTNFELAPGPVAVLVGPNGGGKSTIWKVLAALQEFLQRGDTTQSVFGGSLTRWDTRRNQRLEIVAELGGQRFSYALEVRHAESEQAVVVEEEHLTVGEILVYRFVGGEVQLFGDDGAAKPRTSFPFAPTRSFLPLLEPRPDNQLIMKFRRWLGGIWLFSIQPQLIAGVSESEDRVLARDGSNFASWYRMLAQEKPEVREALRRDLAPFFPGLSEVRLLSSGRTAKRMNLEFEIGGRRFPLEPAELSDGQRALMVLYTIRHAIADGASLLFFDEPDNYLAQREIQPLLAELTGAARNAGATLLVISHHPEVIDYLAPDQVLRLWRGEDGPTRIESVQFDLSMGMTASETLGLEAI